MAESPPESSHLRQTHNDLGTRIQTLTLLQLEVLITKITELTGVSKARVYSYRKTAIQRSYNPTIDSRILLKYIEDIPKSRKPIKTTDEIKNQVVNVLKKNSITKQSSTLAISQQIAKISTVISVKIVWNILYSLSYLPYKPTTKSSLTAEAKTVKLK